MCDTFSINHLTILIIKTMTRSLRDLNGQIKSQAILDKNKLALIKGGCSLCGDLRRCQISLTTKI